MVIEVNRKTVCFESIRFAIGDYDVMFVMVILSFNGDADFFAGCISQNTNGIEPQIHR